MSLFFFAPAALANVYNILLKQSTVFLRIFSGVSAFLFVLFKCAQVKLCRQLILSTDLELSLSIHPCLTQSGLTGTSL